MLICFPEVTQKSACMARSLFKGGLSGWMTSQFLNDLELFSPLSFNLYFQQERVPKLSICHLPTKCSVCVFDITNRTNGLSNF